ncbi:hypothetical protein B0H14DRAFT_2563296 [Mycena olivaceomarginata]|nr:hypothetical protein B0H14DRAFT_2563296 [Mycena olivaceomarginata]
MTISMTDIDTEIWWDKRGTQLNYEQELKDDLDNTIQTLQVRSSTNVDTVRKSLGVESFVKQLSHVVQRSIAVRQRQGNRIWAALIKEQLAPQYGTVAAERGREKKCPKLPESCGVTEFGQGKHKVEAEWKRRMRHEKKY